MWFVFRFFSNSLSKVLIGTGIFEAGKISYGYEVTNENSGFFYYFYEFFCFLINLIYKLINHIILLIDYLNINNPTLRIIITIIILSLIYLTWGFIKIKFKDFLRNKNWLSDQLYISTEPHKVIKEINVILDTPELNKDLSLDYLTHSKKNLNDFKTNLIKRNDENISFSNTKLIQTISFLNFFMSIKNYLISDKDKKLYLEEIEKIELKLENLLKEKKSKKKHNNDE